MEKEDRNQNTEEELLKKITSLVVKPGETTYYNIAKMYSAIYNALASYYEKNLQDISPSELHKEYVKILREDLEKKLKELENKYIELEVLSKEGDKVVKRKIYVNAKLFLELVSEKFGYILFEYVALRMPPPELFILLLQHMEHLYDRLGKLEVGFSYISEFLVSLHRTFIAIGNSLENIRKHLEEINRLIIKTKALGKK